MTKYPWPASGLTEKEMKILYEQKVRSSVPITELIREAVEAAYGKDIEATCSKEQKR